MRDDSPPVPVRRRVGLRARRHLHRDLPHGAGGSPSLGRCSWAPVAAVAAATGAGAGTATGAGRVRPGCSLRRHRGFPYRTAGDHRGRPRPPRRAPGRGLHRCTALTAGRYGNRGTGTGAGTGAGRRARLRSGRRRLLRQPARPQEPVERRNGFDPAAATGVTTVGATCFCEPPGKRQSSPAGPALHPEGATREFLGEDVFDHSSRTRPAPWNAPTCRT